MGAGKSRVGVAGGSNAHNLRSSGSSAGGGAGGSSETSESFMSDEEILSKIKGNENLDMTFSEIIHSIGYDALPTVVGQKEFDSILSKGAVRLTRGIKAAEEKDTAKYVYDLMKGDFYVAGGEAYFGQGMYCFGHESRNMTYMYSNTTGIVLDMALKPNAKIATFSMDEVKKQKERAKKNSALVKSLGNKAYQGSSSDINSMEKYLSDNNVSLPKGKPYSEQINYVMKAYPDFNSDWATGWYSTAKNSYRQRLRKKVAETERKNIGEKAFKKLHSHNILGHTNYALAARGYDAIRLTPDYVNDKSSNGRSEIYIVLNRGALVVNEDKIKKRFGPSYKSQMERQKTIRDIYKSIAEKKKRAGIESSRYRADDVRQVKIPSNWKEILNPPKPKEKPKASQSSSSGNSKSKVIVSKYKGAFMSMGVRDFAEYIQSNGDQVDEVLKVMNKWYDEGGK